MTAPDKLTVEQVKQCDHDASQLLADRLQMGFPISEMTVITDAFARHRQQAEAPAGGLVAALTKAAERFREYEISHMRKGSIEGDAKARSNCEIAEMCETALTAYRSARPT